jgi:hypothetical protein
MISTSIMGWRGESVRRGRVQRGRVHEDHVARRAGQFDQAHRVTVQLRLPEW